MKYSLFVSCPKGFEYVLQEELKGLGLENSRPNPDGVYGEASLAVIYQLCLWSRIANRVQLILFSGSAYNEQSLHQLCTQFHWQTVFSPDKTIAIEFHGRSPQIRNTMFGAQVVKDGIVDHFRSYKGTRPSVDKEKPQIRIHAHLRNDIITVSLDLTGYSLHQRGYRIKAGLAPIKENVAAAILTLAKWPQLAAKGYSLHDPFCGSGTIVIEAAMMAAHVAPGLIRQDQSLVHWAEHQASLWEKIRVDALKQVKPLAVKLLGTDSDPKLCKIADKNAEKAGVLPLVTFKAQPINACKASTAKGLLIANPPYGERLDSVNKLTPLYQQLGKTLKDNYKGWQAAILTADPMLARAMRLSIRKQYSVYNGALKCKLYCLDIGSDLGSLPFS